jgi:hypothetical protein
VLHHVENRNQPRRIYGRDIFKFMSSVIRISLPLVGWEAPDGEGESRVKSKEKILAALLENPACTVQALADLVGITKGGIERNPRLLKNQGILRRIGADNGGHWEVVQTGGEDQVLGQFLRDIAQHPERLQAMDASLVERLQSLVGGCEVDLNAPLSADDE